MLRTKQSLKMFEIKLSQRENFQNDINDGEDIFSCWFLFEACICVIHFLASFDQLHYK